MNADSSGRIVLPLPVLALQASNNEVRLALFAPNGRTTQDDKPLPQTSLDAEHSSLEVSFAGLRPNVNPTLAQLNVAFDSRGWMPRKVVIVTGEDHLDASALTTLSSVVQGLALRLGHVPLSVDLIGHPRLASKEGLALSDAMSRGADVIFFGRRTDLTPYLPARALESIDGPNLNLVALNRGNGVGLIVSGRSGAEVAQAASWLAKRDFPFAWTPFAPVNRPEPVMLAIRQSLQEARYVMVPETDRKAQAAALELMALASQWSGQFLPVAFSYVPQAASPGFALGETHELGMYLRLALGSGALAQKSDAALLIQSSLAGAPLTAITGSSVQRIRQAIDGLHRDSCDNSVLRLVQPEPAPVATAALWCLNTEHLVPLLCLVLLVFLLLARIGLTEQKRRRQALARHPVPSARA
jgi:hypothetical protein